MGQAKLVGHPGFKNVSCLVVDDDEAMRTLVRRLLARSGVGVVIEAEDGEEALRRLESTTPAINLVLCDWQMKKMSGLRLFNELKARNSEIPFIMLTGVVDLESIVEAKKAGVLAYLVKPVSPRDLEAKIAAMVKVPHER